MDTEVVLFEGRKKFVKVNAIGYNRRMIIQPFVKKTQWDMIVGVRLFDEKDPSDLIAEYHNGSTTRTNLVALWRGMLILQELSVLSDGDPRHAYNAGLRNPHPYEIEGINKIVAKIGRELYDRIMASLTKSPIDKMVTLANSGADINLDPIIEEVRARTIHWRDDFERLDLVHPAQMNRRSQGQLDLLARYGSYLANYAESRGYGRESHVMWSIEGFIIEAVEEGLEDVHGQDLVLALAITRGDVVLQLNRVSMPDSKPLLDEIHYRAAHKAAHWTSHQFRTGRFWKKSRRSVKEYEALIRQNLSILNPDPTPSPDKPG